MKRLPIVLSIAAFVIAVMGVTPLGDAAKSAATASQVAPFVGTWENDNPSTTEQTRAVIDAVGGRFEVYGYGRCHPTDCDFAASVGGPRTTPQSDAVDGQLSIVWVFSFKTTSQTLTLLPDGRLRISSFHHFTDASGRPDRTTNEDFHKTTAPAIFFMLELRATGSGRGTITSVPDGFDCPTGNVCSLEIRSGASIKLVATPDADSRLAGWRGACSGTKRTCTLALAGDVTVTALFASSPRCVVPRLKNKTLASARRAIVARHCRLAKVVRAYSSRVRAGRVLAQAPPAGSRLPNRGAVTVVLSRGARR